jgi:hypothetical protein
MSTGSTSDDHRMSTGSTSDGNPMPTGSRRPRRPPIPRLGDLPLARRDVERLRQIIGLQRRLKDLSAAPRVQRALAHRGIFRDALTWLEIQDGTPDLVAHWKAVLAESGVAPEAAADGSGAGAGEQQPGQSRRRRRRRRGRRGFHGPTPH